MAKLKNEEGQELELDDILSVEGDYQAAFDRKVAKALEKQKADTDAEVQKKLDAAIKAREDELRQNIQDEIDAKAKEAAENAQLSEAEKYKKELDKVNQKLTDYENRIAVADREKKMKQYIKEKGYDTDAILDLVSPEQVTDVNYEDRIDDINAKLNDRISKGVASKLKDEGEKNLGGKGGSKEPEFHFDFQPLK